MKLIPWLVGWLWFAPSPPVCRVRVEGMPAPQMRHHELLLGRERRIAAAEVELPRHHDEVLLVGPRYRGAAQLPASCEEPVVLDARPKPAEIEMDRVPIDAVVTCSDCPGIDPHVNYLPTNLPPVVMDAWSIVVTLRVRAPGYEPARHSTVLHPGRNIVSLSMTARVRK